MPMPTAPADALPAVPDRNVAPAADRTLAARDRIVQIALSFACLLVYAYFFQGYGFNQNAHFLTTRALVENGTLEITPLLGQPHDPRSTGDVGLFDGRAYSSKASGLPLFAAPAYFVVWSVERAAGVDPSEPDAARINQYLTTVWASAMPAALLVGVVYRALRRDPTGRDRALLLATAFAFGTLAFPYAGLMMTHNLVALCLFTAWYLLSGRAGASDNTTNAGDDDDDRAPSRWAVLAAGGLLGLAILCEYIVAPLVGLFGLWALIRRPLRRRVAYLAVGPVVAVAAILAIHWATFGHPLAMSYDQLTEFYKDQRLFLGIFGWPDPRRLYWLSVHPHRGLLYAAPVFFLCLLALLQPRWRDVVRRHAFPLVVFGYFLLFNLCFYGWTGGFATGPRYLIPGLPFLFLLAAAGLARYPRIGLTLMVISTINMLAVTAVRVQWPGKSHGPPLPDADDPIGLSFRRLTFNQVARDPGSFNLGQPVGLNGVWSLVPVALLIGLICFVAWRADHRRTFQIPRPR